jgi:hypothetical protein
MHTTIHHLTAARDALHAATQAGPFPERDEVAVILSRVGEIADTHAARTAERLTMPAADDAPSPHVCPFAACADTGLLPNGDVCVCTAPEGAPG